MHKNSKIRTQDPKIVIKTKRYYQNMPSQHLCLLNQEQATEHYFIRNSTTLTTTTKYKESQRNIKSYRNLKSALQQLEDKVRIAHSQIVISHVKQPSLHHIQSNINSQNNFMKITQSTKMLRNTLLSPNFSAPNLSLSSSMRKNCQRKYYISELARAVNQKNSLAIDHVNTSIEILKFCRNLQMPQGFELQSRQIILQKDIKYRNKKTLLLDLDETLIHTNQNNLAVTDVNLSFKTSSKSSFKISINIRPYALTFLKKMSKKFEIIVFTASHANYANQILDYLDPNNQYFAHRLYRQHCTTLQNGLHVKDLRLINRPLSEMILVDNAAYSYAFQIQNGIPILPYYDGKDTQLSALEAYLQYLDQFTDVRQCNKETFKLHHYIKFDNAKQLIQQLYMSYSR